MDKFRSVIQTEFRQFEEVFAGILQSDNPLLNEVLDYVYAKRGKLRLVDGSKSMEDANREILSAIGAKV